MGLTYFDNMLSFSCSYNTESKQLNVVYNQFKKNTEKNITFATIDNDGKIKSGILKMFGKEGYFIIPSKTVTTITGNVIFVFTGFFETSGLGMHTEINDKTFYKLSRVTF